MGNRRRTWTASKSKWFVGSSRSCKCNRNTEKIRVAPRCCSCRSCLCCCCCYSLRVDVPLGHLMHSGAYQRIDITQKHIIRRNEEVPKQHSLHKLRASAEPRQRHARLTNSACQGGALITWEKMEQQEIRRGVCFFIGR